MNVLYSPFVQSQQMWVNSRKQLERRQADWVCAKCTAFYISVGKIGFASVHGKVPFAWHFLDNRAL